MKKDEKVTVRINGEEQSYVESYKINDWQRATDEFAATADEEEIRENMRYHVNVVKTEKKSMQRTTVLIVSIVSAIMIGLLLGFILLYLMKHEDTLPTAAKEQPIQEQPKPIEKAKPEAAIKKQLDELAIVGLQANIFSSKDGAEAYLTELKGSHEIAGAIIQQNEQYSVIVGVSKTVEEAKKIIETESEKLGDLYAKELVIKGREYEFQSAKNYNDFKEMNATYNDLVTQLNGAKLNQTVDQTAIETINQQLQVKEEHQFSKELVQKHGYLQEAATLLKDFTSTKSESALIEIEQALLNFITEY